MRQAALTIVSMFTMFFLVSCTGGDGTGAPSATTMATSATTSPSAPTSESSAQLTIAGHTYSSDLVVEPGTTITVHNIDPVPHDVVAEDGSFRTSSIAPDESAMFTAPSKPGQYPFVCTLQPGMRATLTVVTGPLPEQSTSTPKGSTSTPKGSTSTRGGRTSQQPPPPGHRTPGTTAPPPTAPGSSTPG